MLNDLPPSPIDAVAAAKRQAEIDAHVREFLARGGVVEQVPAGVGCGSTRFNNRVIAVDGA